MLSIAKNCPRPESASLNGILYNLHVDENIFRVEIIQNNSQVFKEKISHNFFEVQYLNNLFNNHIHWLKHWPSWSNWLYHKLFFSQQVWSFTSYKKKLWYLGITNNTISEGSKQILTKKMRIGLIFQKNEFKYLFAFKCLQFNLIYTDAFGRYHNE